MAIKAEISLDSSKAEAEASRAGAAIAGHMAKSSQSGTGGGFFKGAESGMTKLVSGINLVKMAWNTAKQTIVAADEIGDVRDAVESVLPPSQNLNEEMEKLVKLSESPGLEFTSVARAHATFLALGKSSEQSMDTIKEIGNALQLSGSDPENLTAIVETLTKMEDAGKPNIKMLHSLTNQSVAFREAFKKGFDTDSITDLESRNMTGEQFMEGFVSGLKGLKTASKDAMDSLGDTEDAIKRTTAAATISTYEQSKRLKEMVTGGAESGRSKESEAATAARMEAIAAATKKRVYALQEVDELENKIAVSKLKEKEGTDAEKEAQKKSTDELTLKLRLQKELATLMKSQQISAEAAAELIKRQVELARVLSDEQERLAGAKKKAENSDEIAKRKRDTDIMEAKSKGHEGKAGRLQKAADLADKQKELEAMGMSPADAKKRATEEVRIADDAAFREKTGRSRTHQGERRGMDGLGPRGSAKDTDKFGDQNFPRLEGMGRTQKGATTKLTPAEMAGTQARGKESNIMDHPIWKTLEAAAKKFNASNLNTAN